MMAATGHAEPAVFAPFAISLESTEMSVRSALAEVLESLSPLHLDVEEAGSVELVLAEVLNNIVEHAYHAKGEPGPIEIHCEHRQNGLLVCFHDRGAVLPDGKIPFGAPAVIDVQLEDLPEGGFGWFLIHNLAKDVRYERDGEKNRLSLRIAVGQTG